MMVRLYTSITASLLTLPLCAQTIEFERDVWPVLETSCVKCHRPPFMEDGKLKKPKAGLVLDSAVAIMLGGDNGAVVVPGKPDQSDLYTLTTLDEDDDDVMPSKGDPLTPAQQKILHDWIQQGAKFGGWKGNEDAAQKQAAHQDAPRPEPVHPLDLLAEGVPAVPTERLRQFSKATVVPVSTKNPLLRVDYINASSRVTDSDISRLAPIARHITSLDLSDTSVTDKSMRLIGAMRLLTRLDLHDTAISDVGLREIHGLKHLETLNLYNTKVSDKCLPYLAQLEKIDRLYLWNTAITPEGISKLKQARRSTLINYNAEMPYPEIAPTNSVSNRSGNRRRRP